MKCGVDGWCRCALLVVFIISTTREGKYLMLIKLTCASSARCDMCSMLFSVLYGIRTESEIERNVTTHRCGTWLEARRLYFTAVLFQQTFSRRIAIKFLGIGAKRLPGGYQALMFEWQYDKELMWHVRVCVCPRPRKRHHERSE